MIGYIEVLTVVRQQLNLFDGNTSRRNVDSYAGVAYRAGMDFIKANETDISSKQKEDLEGVVVVQIHRFKELYKFGMFEDSSK